jgi:signal transduction protein with GAF and PtsI domain
VTREAMSTPRIKIGESFTGIVAATGQPLVVWDPANDPRLTPAHREAYRRGGYRAFLGLPLKVGTQVLLPFDLLAFLRAHRWCEGGGS